MKILFVSEKTYVRWCFTWGFDVWSFYRMKKWDDIHRSFFSVFSTRMFTLFFLFRHGSFSLHSRLWFYAFSILISSIYCNESSSLKYWKMTEESNEWTRTSITFHSEFYSTQLALSSFYQKSFEWIDHSYSPMNFTLIDKNLSTIWLDLFITCLMII